MEGTRILIAARDALRQHDGARLVNHTELVLAGRNERIALGEIGYPRILGFHNDPARGVHKAPFPGLNGPKAIMGVSYRQFGIGAQSLHEVFQNRLSVPVKKRRF